MDKKRILLVDDDSGLLTSLSFVLEQEGYDVLPAADGEAAVEKFRSEDPDIVVLDIKMPRKDGTEVLSEIRTVSQIPVIFLTSKDTEVDELFGLRAGADDYISKPFSTALLVERIRVLLKRGGNGETSGEGTAPPTRPTHPRFCPLLLFVEGTRSATYSHRIFAPCTSSTQ